MVGTLEKHNNAAGFAAGANTAAGTLTAALSGGTSGDPWDRLIIPGDVGAGNTLEILTTPTPPSAPAGNKWYHAAQAAGTPALKVYWTKPTARTIWACDFYLDIIAAPASGAVNLFQTYADAVYGATNQSVSISLNASRSMFLRNGKTGEAVSGGSSVASLALNTQYYVQMKADYTALTATLNAYLVGSSTVALTCTVPFTTSNTIQSMWWGLGTASTAADILITNIREGFGDFLARPDIASSGPVITQGAAVRRTYLAGTVIDMPWSATDADNVSTLSVAWQTLPSGVTGPAITDKSGAALTGIGTTTASRTSQATPTQPGTYVATVTATDSTGASTTASYTLEIYPGVGVDTIIRAVSKGSFAVVGGGADTAAGALAALNDTDANTALDSVVTPTNMTGSLQLGPLGPSGIVLYASSNVIAGGSLRRVWTVYKEDHTTQIYTVTETGITGPTADVPLALDNNALSLVPLNSPTDLGRAGLWVDWSDTVT